MAIFENPWTWLRIVWFACLSDYEKFKSAFYRPLTSVMAGDEIFLVIFKQLIIILCSMHFGFIAIRVQITLCPAEFPFSRGSTMRYSMEFEATIEA